MQLTIRNHTDCGEKEALYIVLTALEGNKFNRKIMTGYLVSRKEKASATDVNYIYHISYVE